MKAPAGGHPVDLRARGGAPAADDGEAGGSGHGGAAAAAALPQAPPQWAPADDAWEGCRNPTTLLLEPLASVPRGRRFLSCSRHGFDAEEIALQVAAHRCWRNPYTRQPFSAAEVGALRAGAPAPLLAPLLALDVEARLQRFNAGAAARRQDDEAAATYLQRALTLAPDAPPEPLGLPAATPPVAEDAVSCWPWRWPWAPAAAGDPEATAAPCEASLLVRAISGSDDFTMAAIGAAKARLLGPQTLGALHVLGQRLASADLPEAGKQEALAVWRGFIDAQPGREAQVVDRLLRPYGRPLQRALVEVQMPVPAAPGIVWLEGRRRRLAPHVTVQVLGRELLAQLAV